MIKIIICLSFSICFTSCANLTREFSNYEKGLDCIHYEQYWEATKYLALAINEKPDDVNVHFFLGLAYAKIGQFNKALECFNKSISIDPNYWLAWSWKGGILKELGNEKESLECIQKGLELKKIEEKKEKQKK